MTKYTQQEFLAEARRRFGRDPMGWAFVCPACGDIATGADIRDALATRSSDKTASDLLGQVCIGRLLGALGNAPGEWTGRGCDWCAFGLIPGPVIVVLPNGGALAAFEFAPEQRVPSA